MGALKVDVVGESAHECMDQRDVQLLTPLEVGGIVAVTRVSLHQHRDLPARREISMGQRRIIVQLIPPVLHLVTRFTERRNGIALKADRTLTDGGCRRTRYLDAVEGVGVAGIPIVGVDHHVRPDRHCRRLNCLRLRLVENAPVPVQVRSRPILPRPCIGAVGIDHRDDVECEVAEFPGDARLFPGRHAPEQPEHSLRRRRLVAVLTAEDQQSDFLCGVRLRCADPHQPDVSLPRTRLPDRRYRYRRSSRRIRLQLLRHLRVRRHRRPGACRSGHRQNEANDQEHA